MNEARWLERSERWARLLLRLYPSHFREEMGEAVVETYRDRSRAALRRGGVPSLLAVWTRALADSLRNGVGERLRPSIAWRRMGNWGRDSELVLRRLSRAPLFVATMVGTLTVGLGAFAVVYAAVDKVLIEPLPYEDPDDLYFVWRDYGPIFDLNRGWLGGTDVAALRDAGGVIQDVAGMQGNSVTLGGGPEGEPQEVAALETTPNFFDLLGVSPLLGRGFASNEGGPGRPPVAVLTHDLWTRQFGADPSVVGSEIRLNGEPFTVIGVMGRDFRFVRHSSLGPPQGADLYTTLDFALAETNPGAGSYAGLSESLRQQRVSAVLISGFSLGALLLAAMGLFGVVAGSVTRRRHELAVRMALGAERGRVLRLVLGEGMLLVLLGLLLGLPARRVSGIEPAGLLRQE